MSKSTSRVSTQRSRGGQPGNQNARTHGYYSRKLTPYQQRALHDAALLKGVDRETAKLCLKISSILAVDSYNYTVFKRALSSLAYLIRHTQYLDDSQMENALRKLVDLSKRLACVEALDRQFAGKNIGGKD
jgi:hypothetical protein